MPINLEQSSSQTSSRLEDTDNKVVKIYFWNVGL